MDVKAVDAMLLATLEDHKLSRGEKHALSEVVADQRLDHDGLAFWRHRAFDLARQELETEDDKQVIDWLEGVVKLLGADEGDSPTMARVCFSPGPECLQAILGQLSRARRAVDICVFTITDNRLRDAILEADRRGVRLRIITDQNKAEDTGSDVWDLDDAGISVRVDQSKHHMHHKFAVFDGATAVTGSYNWTRSAAEYNQENVLITDDPRLVDPYREMFDRFWSRLG